MADEIIKRDENRVTVLAGITDDAAQEIRMLRVDPTTGRLKLSMSGIAVAATVDVGTTTNGLPGTNAIVTNVGTTSAAIFDFTIPVGSVIYSTFGIPLNTVGVDGDWAFDTSVNAYVYYKSGGAWAQVNSLKGPQGIQGVAGPIGLTWQGAYNNGTSYVLNDGVSYNGSSYICILASTGNLPTNGTYWNLIAQKGADGAGSGDVTGPASSVADNIATYADTTGKTIKDSGVSISSLVPYTGSSTDLDLNAKSFKNFFISKTADVTAKMAFDVLGLSTATTRTLTVPNRSFTLDNITTATTTNGTGFIKGNGSVVSFDNSTYLTSVGTGVANEITYWSGTNTLGSLATATYPSLTELSYVKGVTSAIQTQITAKADKNGGNWTFASQAIGDLAYATSTTAYGRLAAPVAGKILASGGVGAAPVYSVPTFPTSASATSGKIIKSDGTNWVASTETYAAPGTSGNVLTSDGTNWTSAVPSAGGSSLWTLMPGTPTRVGNASFTVTGDVTSYVAKGMIIKWTESSTVRVAMVSIPSTYSSPNTTITIIGDTMASIDASSLKYCMLGVEMFQKNFAVAGNIAVGTDIANKYYATEPMRLIGVDLQSGTAGVTNTLTIDLNKNGTTFMTTKASLATTVASSPTPFTADSGTSLALGDYVTIDCDATTTTLPIDLYIQLYQIPTRYLSLS